MISISDLEIVKQIKLIEEIFRKEFSGPVKRLMARQMRRLSTEECEKMVEKLCYQRRYSPTPADIAEQVNAIVRSRPAPVEIEQEVRKCDGCMDSGYAFIRNDTGSDIVAACICPAGEKISEDFGRVTHRGQLEDYPIDKFKPVQGPEFNRDALSERMAWWNGVLAISREYWEHKRKGEE